MCAPVPVWFQCGSIMWPLDTEWSHHSGVCKNLVLLPGLAACKIFEMLKYIPKIKMTTASDRLTNEPVTLCPSADLVPFINSCQKWLRADPLGLMFSFPGVMHMGHAEVQGLEHTQSGSADSAAIYSHCPGKGVHGGGKKSREWTFPQIHSHRLSPFSPT